MRFLTYDSIEGPRVAAARDGQWYDVRSADVQLPFSLRAMLAAEPGMLDEVAQAAALGEPLDRERLKLLPPIVGPQKIICVGLNYADHAAETGAAIPGEPLIFNKFPTTLRADGDPIVLPAVSDQVDYEAELVVVIGRRGRHIDQADAMDYVAGYCCGHDVSARDWQKHKPGGQWLLGKSFDSFAPCGPELVTADEIADPHQLDIRLRLNGETMQESNTCQLIFKIDQLISYISQVATLEPGDLIYTGTPPGVGMARRPPVFLKPGDEVEVEIDGVGRLRNAVVAAS
ncbi:MAG: FAA hydrolase family protein [Planctomycetota bacterium]|nr:MAG: FAA hydrolase family protein [Planctomycetota bacterium]REK46066.1 MAG: FAA hydrolase family protein [Planctomycetota bacterium]